MTQSTKAKILVADSDPDALRLTQAALTSHGHEVVTTGDGLEALHKANQENPAAILLEISLPKLDGIALCAKLKKTPSTARIPVGFLTAENGVGSYGKALQAGGLVFITKPVDPDKLQKLVEMMLSARPPES